MATIAGWNTSQPRLSRRKPGVLPGEVPEDSLKTLQWHPQQMLGHLESSTQRPPVEKDPAKQGRGQSQPSPRPTSAS